MPGFSDRRLPNFPNLLRVLPVAGIVLAALVGLVAPPVVHAIGRTSAAEAGDSAGGSTNATPTVCPPGGHSPAGAPANGFLRPKALSGPIDEAQYIVGPGDTFSITIHGISTEAQTSTVSPEGNLILPGVSTVRVSGQSLTKAKDAVREALAAQYRDVDVSIDLIALRHILVHVVGQVTSPGTYTGTPLDPASVMIEMAGGLQEGASRRRIVITHRNGEARPVDLDRYERLGDLSANPPIAEGDVIHVPFLTEEVLVEGAVQAPGMYELTEGDRVPLLLRLAGGFTRDALRDTVEIREFVSQTETISIPVPVDSPDATTRRLRDGDQIYVRYEPDHRIIRTVTIDGEVRFPGVYGINEGVDRLSDVILRAGGFTPEASLAETQFVRTKGVEKDDLEFERLRVIPVENMTKTEYAYFKSKSRERKGTMVVDFALLDRGDASQDREVRDGDRIVVPKNRVTVTVSGSVRFPGLIPYVPGMPGGYYVQQAGGFSSTADRGGARVIQGTTGERESLGDAGVIVPGQEVWVPESPEHDWWQFAQDAVRFAASIATVYLVIDQASGN